ncbi:lipid A phosphoethanolamine transferase [Salmonella enterica subsp. enterica]|nr:lipid A phosphoethanolamine transferase [Salmonella enterica subsp. enterica serovar Amherstiana]
MPILFHVQKKAGLFIFFTIASFIITWSCGYTIKNASGNTLLLLFMLLLARKNTLTSVVVMILILFSALYAPTGLTYGKINNGFIASFLQTTTAEALEFIQLIPFSHFFISFAILIFALLFWRTRQSSNKNRFALLLFVALSINSWPKRMIAGTVTGTREVIQEMNHYAELNRQQHDTWELLPGSQKYQTIVVIVGESVNRNYMSAYGYPLPTTPWLNAAPGIFVNGYTSTAANTITSLSRTLVTDYEHSGNPGNNVVSLAKRAGYRTWWLSAQGRLGVHDTLIAVIASNAEHTVFLNSGSYSSRNIDDNSLLPVLDKVLNDDDPMPRIIFIHMMGSHPNPCDRLSGWPNPYHKQFDEKIACYLASINKLDNFLMQVDSRLRQRKERFAMVYFSDHGLSVSNGQSPVHHDARSRAGYDIPLIITASDINSHRTIDNTLSARYFMGIFEWVTGIRSQNIQPVNPEIPQARGIVRVFNGQQYIPYDSLPVQPLVQEPAHTPPM